MSHRDRLIALIFLEALLWLFVTETLILPFQPDLTSFGATLGSHSLTLYQIANIGALALAFIIGMRSRAWQGAIALNLLASAPAVILAALTFRLGVNTGAELLALIGPLAALGWFGWLLRYARVELAS